MAFDGDCVGGCGDFDSPPKVVGLVPGYLVFRDRG